VAALLKDYNQVSPPSHDRENYANKWTNCNWITGLRSWSNMRSSSKIVHIGKNNNRAGLHVTTARMESGDTVTWGSYL